MNLIQPNEISTKLPPTQALSLLMGLNTVASEAGRVWCAFTYTNQTDAPKAVPGVDYIALPGVAPNLMLGEITEVARRQDDGGVYFRMRVFTRPDGLNPSKPRSFRPEGINEFVLTGIWYPMNEGE